MNRLTFAILVVSVFCMVQCVDLDWASYKGKYGKMYSSREDEIRKENYFRELEKIRQHNARVDTSWKMGVNQFSDMSSEEKMALLGARVPESQTPKNYLVKGNERQRALPSELDLRNDCCMPPIKQQGYCGSCYAFAAITPLEYLYCKQENVTTLFSEQQLVDCDPKSWGCEGGWYSSSWDYLRKNGVMAAKSYPNESNGTCRFDKQLTVANVKEYYYVQPSAVHMVLALNYYGPLAVAFATSDNFFSYRSGIFTDESCGKNRAVNHGMVIVGYGSDPLEGAFWVVRNSWGTAWGGDGYALVRRGLNECMIESLPAFPALT